MTKDLYVAMEIIRFCAERCVLTREQARELVRLIQ